MRRKCKALLALAFLFPATAGHACTGDIVACLTGGSETTSRPGYWHHVFKTNIYGEQSAFQNRLHYDLAFSRGPEGQGRLESRSGSLLVCPMTWEVTESGKIVLGYMLHGRELQMQVTAATYQGADHSDVTCGYQTANLVITQAINLNTTNLITNCYHWVQAL
ncbi:hypothetical protein [Breoghania sp.]|uniref:hypothetical protein n=1 Tax=Breoghania sp. TaxID=2065378 RepID=UPI0026318803|nr:hypothetical protein [Breoghania sp.]MDJ0932494.1 hypothetical protein [Breoghania sp.]